MSASTTSRSASPELDAAFVEWEAGGIEGAHNWDVKGSVNFIGSKDGYAAHLTDRRKKK